MISNKLLEILTPLLKHGFRVVGYREEWLLGSILIDLEGRESRIRITRDRGEWLAVIAPRVGSEWWTLDVLSAAIGRGDAPDPAGTLHALISGLSENIGEWESLLAADSYAINRELLQTIAREEAIRRYGTDGSGA